MRTNRDLYHFVSEVLVAFADYRRSLEEYLRALLALGSPHSEEMGIRLEAFASMLTDGFTAEPSSVDPGWDHADLRFDGADPGYIGWERVLVSQILDLRAMALDDTLANELRYFGVEAKRPPDAKRSTGAHWVNFDPLTYIECATVGAFGGWEPGDGTGRQLVPGRVAVLGEDGTIIVVAAEEVDRPTIELETLDWAMLVDFLECGQTYE
jgi:hypothetical protein